MFNTPEISLLVESVHIGQLGIVGGEQSISNRGQFRKREIRQSIVGDDT